MKAQLESFILNSHALMAKCGSCSKMVHFSMKCLNKRLVIHFFSCHQIPGKDQNQQLILLYTDIDIEVHLQACQLWVNLQLRIDPQNALFIAFCNVCVIVGVPVTVLPVVKLFLKLHTFIFWPPGGSTTSFKNSS